jgi:agmatinase
VAAGVVPLSVGGDHSISYSILRTLGQRPVGMLHIDAHCDTSGPFEGSKFHHGGPFPPGCARRGSRSRPQPLQIGIRGGGEYLWEFSAESGMTVFHAEDVDGLGLPAIIERSRSALATVPSMSRSMSIAWTRPSRPAPERLKLAA